jgi:hypothetical protein
MYLNSVSADTPQESKVKIKCSLVSSATTATVKSLHVLASSERSFSKNYSREPSFIRNKIAADVIVGFYIIREKIGLLGNYNVHYPNSYDT